MTLGENIWADAVKKSGIGRCYYPTLPAFGEIIIAAIDQAFEDLRLDHQADLEAMEFHYTEC